VASAAALFPTKVISYGALVPKVVVYLVETTGRMVVRKHADLMAYG
jgi:hypothetical protein